MKQQKKRKRPKTPEKKPRASRRRTRPAPAVSSGSAVKLPTLRPDFTVVGIGASAGGLEACSQLLGSIPVDTGMAFILVQHLSPKHVSALPTLLATSTRMPVDQVTEGVQIRPNHLYIIPPDSQMDLVDGSLHLTPRPEGRSQHTPIDHFLRSLARECRDRSIGVILSGTASDGAQGVREIKAAGGIAIAQDPATAHYGGMPHAAIATGLVDIIAAPQDIGRHLVEISKHSYVRPGRQEIREDEAPTDDLRKIYMMLRAAKGVDFSLYKPPTIRRRIARRMALQKIEDMETYTAFLKDTPSEVDALYHDILIQVTHFFREGEALDVLQKEIFPMTFQSRSPEVPARIWVPGCATGEEVYSIAILLLEHLDGQTANPPVQIFGTDVSEAAVEYARNGVYSQSIAEHVTPERLRRFFAPGDGSYRISKKVRDLCIFARQDLTRDPPFSRLDIIVCRNVLIYLAAPLQRKLMSVFHYALRPTGFLVLGKAETVGPGNDLFTVVNKKHRIFSRKHKDHSAAALFSPQHPANQCDLSQLQRPPAAERSTTSVLSQASQCLLDRFAPPGVVVNSSMQIIQFRGQTGAYLEPAPGNASLNLLKMAREGLLYGLRTAVHTARKKGTPSRKDGLRVKSNGGYTTVSVEVIPLMSMEQEKHYLVVFHEGAAEGKAARKSPRPKAVSPRSERHVARLQQELAASRDYLQSMIQDLEAANEELQSANEEILSSNEELQSTNEELDTAKEELQSINEELNTVNEELHGRNEELSRVNSDLTNLLNNIQVAIVMVSSDLRIRRYTPAAERLLNLIPGDVGRPIGNIQPNFEAPGLQQSISDVIDSVSVHQRDVQDRQGRWFQLVIRPYKNMANQIDGAVLALYELDAGLRQEGAQAAICEMVVELAGMVGLAAVVLDKDLRIRQVNGEFAQRFQAGDGNLQGRHVMELEDEMWHSRDLASSLRRALSDDGKVSLEIAASLDDARRVLVRGRRLAGEESDPMVILVIQEEPVHGSPHPH